MIVGVAMGLIVDPETRSVLMTLRGPEQTRPNMWELPGGRVETYDDSLAHAAARELFEELGVQAEIGAIIDTWNVELEHSFHMTCFAARILSGTPKPLAAADLEWFDIDYAIVRLACVPSTYQFYKRIKEHLACP